MSVRIYGSVIYYTYPRETTLRVGGWVEYWFQCSLKISRASIVGGDAEIVTWAVHCSSSAGSDAAGRELNPSTVERGTIHPDAKILWQVHPK